MNFVRRDIRRWWRRLLRWMNRSGMFTACNPVASSCKRVEPLTTTPVAQLVSFEQRRAVQSPAATLDPRTGSTSSMVHRTEIG